VAKAQEYLGSYRLLNLVGTGRKCEVWDAMHDALGERRACKLILPQYADDKEQLSLLRQEYMAAKELDHKNVIHVYEFNVDRHVPFLAMEYFPSVNLKEVLRERYDAIEPLIPKIIERAAMALAHVHDRGWVHRDIKPDNFLVNDQGEVKLIDFALAERKKGAFARLLGGRGKVAGTRSYMSPEQIRGQSLDERSDLYSFACMVFEMLAGRPPFTGQTTDELLNKHLRNPPPSIEAQNKNVMTEFSNLIKKCLAKDREDRPQSMVDFLREMQATRVFRRPPALVSKRKSEE
jgi:serine/threonine protein kinase